jgi:hypothetical protein
VVLPPHIFIKFPSPFLSFHRVLEQVQIRRNLKTPVSNNVLASLTATIAFFAAFMVAAHAVFSILMAGGFYDLFIYY